MLSSRMGEEKSAQSPGFSRFSSVVGTNYVPIEDEISEMREILVEPLAKLKLLQAEVDRAYTTYQDLFQQQDSLAAEIEGIRSLMSPIRRMPTDILQEIFFRCLPGHNSVMSVADCPILLTLICRSWRNIALATPRIWSSLHIPIPSYDDAPIGRPSEREAHQNMLKKIELIHATAIGEWLGRSGGLPLHISLASRPNYNFRSYGYLIIDALIGFSSRWHTIHFNCPSSQLAKIAAVKDSPMLESIMVEEQQDGVLAPGESQNSGLLKAPNLTKVSLKHANYDLNRLPLRWPQLTFISLAEYNPAGRHFSLPSLVVTLKPCVQLLTLHLDTSLTFMSQPIPQTEAEAFSPLDLSLTLPSLTDLSVKANENHMETFFQSLHTPSLLTFEFRTQRIPGRPGSDFECLLSFLSRPHGVRKLTLDPEGFSPHLLIELLKLCPQVVSLSILGRQDVYLGEGDGMEYLLVNNSVLDGFVSNATGLYLCPEMEDFECQYRASFTDEELLQFIMKKQDRSRVPPVAKLRRVRVAFDRTGAWPISEETQRYVEEGLEVNVSYKHEPFFARRTFSPRNGLPLDNADYVDSSTSWYPH